MNESNGTNPGTVILDEQVKEEPKEFTQLQLKFHEFLKEKGEDPFNAERFEDHKVMWALFSAGAVANYELTVPMLLKYLKPKSDFKYTKWVIRQISLTFSA